MAKKKAVPAAPVLEPEIVEVQVLEIPEPIITAMEPYKPEEYSLDQAKADEISLSFRPQLLKMAELLPEYNQILSEEITEDLVKRAKKLRLALVPIRTGTAAIHKQQKEIYLKPGKFIDAWKTAQEFASTEMESKLQNIEKHFENREAERKQLLNIERVAVLRELGVTEFNMDFGGLPNEVWVKYLEGEKLAIEANSEKAKQAAADKIKADQAAKDEAERLKLENKKLLADQEKAAAEKSLHESRLKTLMPLRAYLPDEFGFTDLHLKDAAFLREAYTNAKALYDKDMADQAETARVESERKAAEEKLANSGEAVRLTAWVDSFDIPDSLNIFERRNFSEGGKEKYKEILQKFTAFKKWATKLVSE